MFSTVVYVTVYLAMLPASMVLWALCLRLGLRWVNAKEATMRRVVTATVTAIGVQVGLGLWFLTYEPDSEGQHSLGFQAFQFAVGCLASFGVVARFFKIGLIQAFLAWLPTLAASTAMTAFSLLVVQPYLFESFVMPTNSMAPTVLGKHHQGICPQCGAANYCSAWKERFAPQQRSMICDRFHVVQSADFDDRVHSGDRFSVAKFYTPRRWDLVLFECPDAPGILYVKRLVGLPGETIHIDQGMVWADGVALTPPESIAGLEYQSQFPRDEQMPRIPGMEGPKLWGSPDRPAALGVDEYFVLGDFPAQSADSRAWNAGAPGHNPFAVPQSHMKGVVTHTYWPPSRWRVHR